MLEVRYVGSKVWLNFACALVGGIVAVIVIGSLWAGTALIGGIAGMVAVVAMLLPGVVKRGACAEPILTIDRNGVTVALLDVGLIPWSRIQSTRISGMAWVTGQRLVLEYTGAAPKVGFGAKLSWGMQAKQVGETARLTIGFIDLTDQSKQEIEEALSRVPARAA
jgi:hypothetical protein